MAPLWSEQDLSMTGVDGPDGRWAGPLRPALLLGGADEGDMLSRFQSLLSTHVAFLLPRQRWHRGWWGLPGSNLDKTNKPRRETRLKSLKGLVWLHNSCLCFCFPQQDWHLCCVIISLARGYGCFSVPLPQFSDRIGQDRLMDIHLLKWWSLFNWTALTFYFVVLFMEFDQYVLEENC